MTYCTINTYIYIYTFVLHNAYWNILNIQEIYIKQQNVFYYVLFPDRFFSKTTLRCSPRLYLLDQKYSKNSNTVKYY